MEVKEAPRLQSRLGAKASEKLKWTMVNAFTASLTIVQHAVLYFQPAMLA